LAYKYENKEQINRPKTAKNEGFGKWQDFIALWQDRKFKKYHISSTKFGRSP